MLIFEQLETRCHPSGLLALTAILLDAAGDPVASVEIGDTFTCELRIQDLRANPLGVNGASAKIYFDDSLIEVSGQPTFNSEFFVMPFSEAIDGGIHVYAMSPANVGIGASTADVFATIPMRAIGEGEVTLNVQPGSIGFGMVDWLPNLWPRDVELTGTALSVEGVDPTVAYSIDVDAGNLVGIEDVVNVTINAQAQNADGLFGWQIDVLYNNQWLAPVSVVPTSGRP